MTKFKASIKNKHPDSSFEIHEIISNLLILQFALVGISAFVITTFNLRGNTIEQSENVEKLFYMTLLVVSITLVSLLPIKFQPRNSFFLYTLALAGAMIGLLAWEHPEWRHRLWLGFEWPYLMIFTLVLIFFNFSRNHKRFISNKTLKSVISVYSLYLVISYSLSVLQNHKSLTDTYSFSYVNNELLGPINGKFQFSNFNYQYTNLQGLILFPFKWLGGDFFVTHLTDFTSLSLTLFAFCTVFLMAKIIRNITPVKTNLLSLGISCGWLNFVQVGQIGYQGSLITSQTSVQIRFFSLFAIILIMPKAYKLLFSGSLLRGSIFFFFGFLFAMNNLDFGLIAFLSSLILLNIYEFKPKNILITITVLFLSIFLFVILLKVLTGDWFNSDYVLFFQNAYSNSYVGSTPINFGGPVLVVIPLLIVGFLVPLGLHRNGIAITEEMKIAHIISLTGVIGFPYYLNRSIASTQLQIFIPISLLALSPLLFSILNGYLKSPSKKSTQLGRHPFNALVLSICLGLLVFTANPFNQISRLKDSFNSETLGYPDSAISKHDLEVIKAIKLPYFGDNGNLISLKTSTRNVTIFNSVTDVLISEKAMQMQCEYLRKNDVRNFVVRWDALNPKFIDSKTGNFQMGNDCYFTALEFNVSDSPYSLSKVTYG